METRLAPRVNIKAKAVLGIDKDLRLRITSKKGSFFRVNVIDISTLGAAMLFRYFLPAGLIVEIGIEGRRFGLKKAMKVKGEIRHCKQIRPFTYRCGIEFLNLSDRSKNIIAQFVAESKK